ncbi:DNA repair protein RecN [Alkalihalobacillus pseudalcaliphilus]|uniref:DNA repair protein RecN n=1 Tax=Alkalihalobacillus pseudalcaliphilus TaxID=79884 RepID=UPI00064DF287|nr:DNA repair protein RecN [Alkalihalobacillus pseudalcaliphilus]KMK77003.1 DNA recombination protein RecN [Alkalihalobacillus pseudalcaliphilus]
MLEELTIKNFAIIDQISISFEKGLTVLTGETGAGKSIIIDAIGLLLGGRGSVEYVRYGESRAEIEGLFIVTKNHPVIAKAQELGIEVEEEMMILRRDLTNQGKSICRVNGKLVTLGILREIGQTLVDIYGQHEHQTLMQPEFHLHMVDSYAKTDKEEYQRIFREAKGLQKRLQQFTQNEQEIAQKIDLYQYQLNEIEGAQLQPNEDVTLSEERYKLANSEKLYSHLQDGYQNLYGEGKGLDFISNALSNLETAATIDKDLGSLLEQMSSSFYLLEEATFHFRDQLEAIDFDPERLTMIESRLNELQQLKRKYGQSVEEILEYAAKIEEELHSMVHKDEQIDKLQNKLESLWLDVKVEAHAITEQRERAAKELIDAIHQQLKELYMEKTKFEIRISEKQGQVEHERFNLEGKDDVEFFISTNQGEPLKPLTKVASGGEISRIMLAIKTIFSSNQGLTSVIFDEVDTGVSGRVAQAIAEKIHTVSVGSQVLCITHLPQVAAMADTHLYISKHEWNERVHTKVKALNKNEKTNEIARMISGVEVTDLTRKHAEELLELANKHKWVDMKS